jgi:hypothetical protein
MYIRIKDNKLICEPFGPDSGVTLTYDAFTYANEGTDSNGWWHISCSYSKSDNKVQGTIFNRDNDFESSTIEKSLTGSETYPEDGVLLAFFGHEGDIYNAAYSDREAIKSGFALKEVRLWGELRSADILENSRNHQIDPTLYINKELFAYYRMVAKKEYGSTYDNFARHNINGEW